MLLLLLSAGTGLLAALCIWLIVKLYKARSYPSMDRQIAEHVFQNVDAYVLLIDKNVDVLRTNFYTQSGTRQPSDPIKVGNLLRCKNGTDAGQCGEHDLCATCPIRQAITKGFAKQQSFEKLEASLTLYTSEEHTSTVDCEVSIAGRYFSVEQTEYMLLTVYDITHLKTTQEELRKARRQAEEADRMKSVFLANTSHEIRTPLNAILGFSELLAAGNLSPDEQAEYAQIIRSNNELLLQLVNDILDLSMIEAGTLEFEFSDVDINVIMEELEGTFRRKQTNDRVNIHFERSYDSCHVKADRKRFTQVLSNFLSNAVKYTEQGEIAFGYQIREQDYYFYVRDTGSGIPPEKMEQMFHRFAKIGSHKQGVGIGLTICRSIVESLGGKVGVESQPGKGSTFWFTAPREQPQ